MALACEHGSGLLKGLPYLAFLGAGPGNASLSARLRQAQQGSPFTEVI